MPVNKEFVREGEAPKFTRELAEEMAKHPVVCGFSETRTTSDGSAGFNVSGPILG